MPTTETETQAPATSALVLIEYQNEWLDKAGKLNGLMQDRVQFDESIINSKAVLEAARQKNIPIIHVTMTLDSSYQLFGKGEYGLRAAIPRAQTWLGHAADIHRDFTPQEGEYVIRERAGASAFAGTTLDSFLRNNGIHEIYLIGYALHVCVESTLRHAHDLGYKTNVIHDASSAFTTAQRDYFLKDIVHHYGHALTADEFIKRIKE